MSLLHYIYKWRLDISIKCNRQQFNCVLPWSPRLYFVESVQLWLMMETKEPADITLCLHVLRSRNCLCGRDLRCNGGGRWYWLLYNNGHRLGVRSVQCHNRGNAQLNFLHLCLSLCLSVRPKSPPAPCPPPPPAPACMTACYRDTPKPSSSRSSAADVTNPSHWMLAFILSIYFCMEI